MSHCLYNCFVGAGFGSKLLYGSGFFYFRFRMKIPVNSAGVVTACYVCTDTLPLSINSLMMCLFFGIRHENGKMRIKALFT